MKKMEGKKTEHERSRGGLSILLRTPRTTTFFGYVDLVVVRESGWLLDIRSRAFVMSAGTEDIPDAIGRESLGELTIYGLMMTQTYKEHKITATVITLA